MLTYLCIPWVALVVVACGSANRQPVYQPGAIESQFMAEIALQRQEYRIAAQEYVRVAQRSDDVMYARRATEFSFEYGLDAYALAGAQRWVELDPGSRRAHEYLGRLYVRRNLLDPAFDSLSIAMGPVADRREYEYAALALDLADSTPAARALEIFTRFAVAAPDDAGLKRTQASLALRADEADRAVEYARNAVQLAPGWPAARFMLANALLAAGDSSSAFEQIAFAVEASPGLESELEFVRLLNDAGQAEEALDRLARMNDRYPNEAALVRVRASTYQLLGDNSAALIDYQQLIANGFYVDEALWQMGRIAFEQGDYAAAINYFQAVRSGPWQMPALIARASAYQRGGDMQSGLAVLDEFVADNPQKLVDTLTTRSAILLEGGETAAAMATLDEALEYRPWDIGLWMSKGDLLDREGEHRGAIDAFRQAYALAPDNAYTLNALGYTLANRTRDYDEALELIRQAVDKNPDSPAFMDSMGWVLFKKRQYEQAQVWLERAYGLLPDPEIAAHLGELYWRRKQRDEAQEIWGQASELFPGNPVLEETMQRFTQ
jgi:tetratricopeptide (TPR) repeat protein